MNNSLIKPRANTFISNVKKYDKYKINNDINLFKEELKRQNLIAKEYKGTSKDLIKNCKNFMVDNKDTINNQYETMKKINKNLKKVIIENNKNAEINKELTSLVNSEEYLDVIEKMKEIKNSINDLKTFMEHEE
tara:strand:- start:650 stop:1051 length:402 start_codon:yes stop_codon:yes gene_type:complete